MADGTSSVGDADRGSTSPRKRSIHESTSEVIATPTKRRKSVASLGGGDDGDDASERWTNGLNGTEIQEDADMDDAPEGKPVEATTPTITPKRRGRPPKNRSQTSTPSKTPSKSIFTTPSKGPSDTNTPKREAADRSARKKSVRALIENVVGDGDSDDEDEDEVTREIYDESDSEEEQAADEPSTLTNGEAATPSKTPKRKPRRKARSPTPPRDLPPHELYFAHNKPGRAKTSDNTLGSLAMLTHDEYFAILRDHKDRHANDIEYLENLHAESFPQWTFELTQGYSICLFGFGSKRALLQKFARHLHANTAGSRKTVIVNGYTHTTTLREVLACIGGAIDPSQKMPASTPATMLSAVADQLSETNLTLTIIVNSIDAAPLRKPGVQGILAQLAALPQVQLVCSVDTADFALLWDIGLRSAFNFVFHDCTTFAPLAVELDVVDEVHELLGRKARRVNGREGVAFVLKSLPENAKNLFQLLVGEVLVAMEDEGGGQTDEASGVEYRMVYNKAVEEFICSSEMAFRTLLKEFHDHQMITSHKDALGTELLSVPFARDELEGILEDLMS